MGAPSGKIADEFGDWIALRPKWLQTAAAKLITAQKRPGAKEISARIKVSERTLEVVRLEVPA